MIRGSYNGDANGDGRINSDDYFRIDSGFLAQPAAPTYHQGDFNFDETINSDDYFLIDSAFLGQGALGQRQELALPVGEVADPRRHLADLLQTAAAERGQPVQLEVEAGVRMQSVDTDGEAPAPHRHTSARARAPRAARA